MKIALLGDIALFGAYSKKENKDLKERLSEISEYLSNFDLVIGNLETPFSKDKITHGAKSAYLCSDLENSEVLKWLYVDGVNLANNHMFDFGEEGYQTTVKELNRQGVSYFGSDGKVWNIERCGNKICFMGYCCYSTNPLRLSSASEGNGINKYNVKDVESALKKANIEGYLPIVAIHAGIEHVNYPSLDHIRAARQLATSAKFVYYGHHPHVVQGVEELDGSLIAHSLGNFCFDDVYTKASGDKPLVELTEQNRTGMILELTIEQNKIVSWAEQGIFIGNDGHIRLVNRDKEFNIYNSSLNECEKYIDSYAIRRDEIIKARRDGRKSKRDLMWFIKRLRPKYLRLMIDMKANSNKYIINVKQYIY